jgi:formylmethanofuran dehydrogenase subunit C
MTGGEVVVLGSAGERAGHRMRRGTLAVAGTAGRHPGHAMIAGTVVVGTGPLLSPGTEMKRGTVVGLDRTADHDPAPGFEPDAKHRPVWMRLLLRRLAALGFPVPDGALGGLFQSWSGDRLSLGRGEVYRWLEV